MRDLLVTLLVLGILPLIPVRPWIGVLAWSWLGYMNPHRLAFGFAFNFPFAQIVGIVTILSIFASKEPKRIPWSFLTVIWLSFVIWMCITTITAFDTAHSSVELIKTLKIQVMIVLTLMVINTPERIKALVWTIALSIGFFGFKGGIGTLLTGGQFLVWGPPGSHIAGNNEIAFAMVMIFPLLRFMQVQSTNKWVRWALLAGMLLVAVSIIASYSRGALVAVVAMAGYLLLKSRQRMLLIIVAPIFIALILAFMPAQWAERMNTIKDYKNDQSALQRLNSWGFAINLANDNPVVGGGFDVFLKEHFAKYAEDPKSVYDAHSIYFEVLAEHGYVGLFLFVMIGLVTVSTGRWIIKRCRGHDELQWASDLAGMIQASMVGYAVGGAFLGLAYFDLFYHLVAIQILLREHVKSRIAVLEVKPKSGTSMLRRPPTRPQQRPVAAGTN